jgi:uncharacterized protein YkwD
MVSLVGLLSILPFRLVIPGIASDGTEPTPEPTVETQPQHIVTVEERFLARINAERAAVGLEPYWWNERAAHVAQRRADDMATRDYFSHKTPEGLSGYVEGLRSEGVITYTFAGENLAMNNFPFGESVERAMDTLMQSSTHRANILDSTFDSVGIGWAEGPSGVYRYVQIFLAGVAP